MKTKLISFCAFLGSCLFLNAQDVTVVNNVGSGNVYWTANTTYHLSGGVFVELSFNGLFALSYIDLLLYWLLCHV